jgi:hypothetical protein
MDPTWTDAMRRREKPAAKAALCRPYGARFHFAHPYPGLPLGLPLFRAYGARLIVLATVWSKRR